jgi:hypothetical protein
LSAELQSRYVQYIKTNMLPLIFRGEHNFVVEGREGNISDFLDLYALVCLLSVGLLIPIVPLLIVLIPDVFAVLVELAILLHMPVLATLGAFGFPLIMAVFYGVIGHFSVLAK